MVFDFIFKHWRFVIIALLVAVIGYYRFLAHYRLVQLNEARRATTLARQALQAQSDASLAAARAIQKSMEATNERNQFEAEHLQALAEGRKDGDGALAPVLRDAAARLRDRQGSGALHRAGSGKSPAMPKAKTVP